MEENIGCPRTPCVGHSSKVQITIRTSFAPWTGIATGNWDRNRDGKLENEELELDTSDRVAAVAARLRAVGVNQPQIEGEVEAVAIHHGIAPARAAIRDCNTCHSPASRVTRAILLSTQAPPVSEVKLVENSEAVLASRLVRDKEGDLSLEPVDEREGVYVFGNSHSRIIDLIGIASVAGAIAVALIHGGLRVRASRRRGRRG
jgi:hypothetical protein